MAPVEYEIGYIVDVSLVTYEESTAVYRAFILVQLSEIRIPFAESYDPSKQRFPAAPNWRDMCSAQH